MTTDIWNISVMNENEPSITQPNVHLYPSANH